MRELHEGHEALSTRVSSVQGRITVHHVQECMRRIILKEERIGVSGGVIELIVEALLSRDLTN